MSSKLSVDHKADKGMPTSTRLSRVERAFIKIAVAKIQQAGRDNFYVSDFLREAGLEKAARVLGQPFSDFSDAA